MEVDRTFGIRTFLEIRYNAHTVAVHHRPQCLTERRLTGEVYHVADGTDRLVLYPIYWIIPIMQTPAILTQPTSCLANTSWCD